MPHLRATLACASFSAAAAAAAAAAACEDDDSRSSSTNPTPSYISSSVTEPTSSSSATSAVELYDSSAAFLCLSSFRPPGASAAAALAASPLTSLLYAAFEAEILVYDLRSLRRVDAIAAAPGAGSVKSAALLADGRLLTAHQDSRVRLWKRGRLQASLPTLCDRLHRLPLPGSYVTVRRHRRRLWVEHADAVSAVVARGGAIYSVSWDRTLKVWGASDLRCRESVAAHDDAVNAVAVAADGTVYTGASDGKVRAWAAAEAGRRHALVATMERHRAAVNALALSADGAVLYSGAGDGSILAWERLTGHVAALRGHKGPVLGLAWAGALLFSGSSDRTIRIWKKGGVGPGEYSCVSRMEGHVHGVRSLVALRMGDDEYRVASGSLDGEIKVWQVKLKI